jgi:uncharacterized protein (UPF0332 family)
MNEQEKLDIINYRLLLIDETLKDAKILLENNSLRGAVNRIYYTMFYAVSALALNNNFQTHKHAQLLGWFNREYVNTGKINLSLGKYFKKAFDKRKTGDYDDLIIFSKDEVEELYLQMEIFIKEIKRLLIP